MDRTRDVAASAPTTAHEERGLGETVHRYECLASETARRECRHEALERIRPDRFGPVDRPAPGAEIEHSLLLGRYAFDAPLVGEVRRGGYRATVDCQGAQPSIWRLHEVERGHEY